LLNIQAKEPFNAEPSAASLVEFPITPEDLVYCRNHGPVREFDADSYMVLVDGFVKREMELRVDELKNPRWRKREVVAALQVSLPHTLHCGLGLTLASSAQESGGTRWVPTSK
jgi:sulfite oxidase